MSSVADRSEMFMMALQSLSRAEKGAVAARLLDDSDLRDDVLDLALIREREGESSRSFGDYLAERKENYTTG